jgi:methylthioribose-1-phosphate isomerase
MEDTAQKNSHKPVSEIKRILLNEAKTILEEDKAICRKIGENGESLLEDGSCVITHCNAGGLATGDYGTALAIMFAAAENGKKISVYADETRPLLQGSRLTAWELKNAGIDVTLICDNMAAHTMKRKKIDCVIVGADRIAANGDTANKIGTYSLSIIAKEHNVPFYVAAPASTFDLSIASGDEIQIEERNPDEVTKIAGNKIAPDEIKVFNPAFDVTPASNITAIITERGVINSPNKEKIENVIGNNT